jgi:uncharacterized protein (DUF1800 family)
MRAPDLRDDPRRAWEPFTPSAEEPWDEARVAHLHRRAGFGAHWCQVVRDTAEGFEASLARVLEGETHGPDGRAASAFDEIVEAMVDSARRRPAIQRVQLLWLFRMLFTPFPLAERMTLAWHGHFATSQAKVDNPLAMLDQNLAQRELWRAPFGRLVLAMIKDPALLTWLDGFESRKAHPNENLARELLELFVLGEGNYTEADVKNVARALTGWRSVRGDGIEPLFDPSEHDDGPETFLGRTGSFGVDDVARIVVAQPAAARHVARRLYRTFISDTDEPSAELLEPLAEVMQLNGNGEIDVARGIACALHSRLFHSAWCRGRRVKAPVDYAIGSLRAAEVFNPPPDLVDLEFRLTRMGQRLFYPPSVAGWPGGLAWLRDSTLLARANYAAAFAAGPAAENRLGAVAERRALKNPDAWSRALETLLFGPPVSPAPGKPSLSHAAIVRDRLVCPEAQLA